MSVIVNYCSNESIFIHQFLKECLKFTSDIVVSYGSHLYNGQPEDKNHIAELVAMYPMVKFVEYPVDINLKHRRGVVHRPTAYFHNLARSTAAKALSHKNWVFVLDVDEIPEGDRVAEWLRHAVLDHNCAYKLANYWYFKKPEFRARTLEDSVLLIHAKHLTDNNIFGDNERDYLIHASGCKLVRMVKHSDNVMFHHFSWVRTQDGLRHKITSWAHANDLFKNANVDAIMEHIYGNDQPNDIVHGYSYDIVPNTYNVLTGSL